MNKKKKKKLFDIKILNIISSHTNSTVKSLNDLTRGNIWWLSESPRGEYLDNIILRSVKDTVTMMILNLAF